MSAGRSWMTVVATSRRPGGISSMAQKAMSPWVTRARVRGMGVAVMASTCGSGDALLCSLARCSTPNLQEPPRVGLGPLPGGVRQS